MTRLLILLTIIIYMLCSCTKYYTRKFIQEAPMFLSNDFKIVPILSAFSGSSRVNLKKDIGFDLYLQIQYIEKNLTIDYKEIIDSLYNIDSIHVSSANLSVNKILFVDSTFYQVKKYLLNGKIHYFDKWNIEIPNDIKKVEIKVFYHEKNDIQKIFKNIFLKMQRFEATKWGPLLN